MTRALVLTELQVLLIVIQKLSKIVIQKDHTFANIQRLGDRQPEPHCTLHMQPQAGKAAPPRWAVSPLLPQLRLWCLSLGCLCSILTCVDVCSPPASALFTQGPGQLSLP